jgi:hypothetical protein
VAPGDDDLAGGGGRDRGRERALRLGLEHDPGRARLQQLPDAVARERRDDRDGHEREAVEHRAEVGSDSHDRTGENDHVERRRSLRELIRGRGVLAHVEGRRSEQVGGRSADRRIPRHHADPKPRKRVKQLCFYLQRGCHRDTTVPERARFRRKPAR